MMKFAISMRYRLPPSTIGKLPFKDIKWMFAAIAYELELKQDTTEEE